MDALKRNSRIRWFVDLYPILDTMEVSRFFSYPSAVDVQVGGVSGLVGPADGLQGGTHVQLVSDGLHRQVSPPARTALALGQ